MKHDFEEFIKLILDKSPEDMDEGELRDLVNQLLLIMTGMFIGARVTTDQMKRLLKKSSS